MNPIPFTTYRNFAAAAAMATIALVGSQAVATTVSLNIVGAESACSGWAPTTTGTAASPVLTLTCITTTPPPPGALPGVCTINGNAGPTLSGTIGNSVTLTASCPNATGYQWFAGFNGSCANGYAGVTCEATATISGPVIYTVKGTNSSGTGPGTNASIQWSTGGSTPPPPPPIGGAISCSGFSNTIVLDVPWASTSPSSRPVTSGFDGSTALVLRFTVPAGYSSASLSRISGVEYGGGPVTRQSALASVPCDFTGSSGVPWQNTLSDTGVASFWLQVGGSSTRFPVVQPGQTYYMNVRNTDSGGRNSCTTQSVCNMIFDVTVPN